MTLNFQKKGSVYEATASISGDAVLVVERANAGGFEIKLSHKNNGNYVPTQLQPQERAVLSGQYIDTVIHDEAYPVYLKFTSTEEVLNAELWEV